MVGGVSGVTHSGIQGFEANGGEEGVPIMGNVTIHYCFENCGHNRFQIFGKLKVRKLGKILGIF
jgi:hypothetical protein